jgi:hypothetical protein
MPVISDATNCLAMGTMDITYSSIADWPTFPVTVTSSWLVKPGSCSKLQEGSGDMIVNAEESTCSKARGKLPLTGFDVCRLRLGFMPRILVFDNPADVEGAEEAGGFKSQLTGVRLRESLAKALEECYPLAGTNLLDLFDLYESMQPATTVSSRSCKLQNLKSSDI